MIHLIKFLILFIFLVDMYVAQNNKLNCIAHAIMSQSPKHDLNE